MGLPRIKMEIGTKFHVFLQQIFIVSTVFQALVCNSEQDDLVPALPSGAEMGLEWEQESHCNNTGQGRSGRASWKR